MHLVILGPTWFHKEKKFKIESQDQLEIKESMITGMDEPMFIATEVKKGDQVLKLRDEFGYPVWAPPRKKHEKYFFASLSPALNVSSLHYFRQPVLIKNVN